MSNFKNWLSANGKSIDMTGDAWQVHEIVDSYADGLQDRIAELECENKSLCDAAECPAPRGCYPPCIEKMINDHYDSLQTGKE